MYWDIILDAIIDTVRVLPFLFIIYYLIELLEYKYAAKLQNNKWLKGKYSPVFGSLVGCVPQCGFSVISSDLYSRGSISCGALIAVFIATSDEAIPLMLSNPSSIGWLLGLIAIKIVFGILVGYLAMLLYRLVFGRKKMKSIAEADDAVITGEGVHIHELNQEEDGHSHNKELKHHNHDALEAHIANEASLAAVGGAVSNSSTADNIESREAHQDNESEKDEPLAHGGCCHHHLETKSYDWLHPLLHCLKISLFILIINLVFGFVTEAWIGEDRLLSFLNQSKFIQPLLAVLIGLIPNCVSSVVLTELFLMNGLTFGSLVAGLCVNAGLGLIVLFRQNKNVKENIFILIMMIVPSVILGYALNWI